MRVREHPGGNVPHPITFEVDGIEAKERVTFEVVRGYNLGFTIRDAAKMQAHLDEVAREGVPRPSTEVPPIIFPISTWAWTTSSQCLVQTSFTSGEVEIFMVDTDEELYVGVASDHTDRKLEAVDIPWSKQVAPNVVAPTIWRWSDVSDHWDECTLDSWVREDGVHTHYQHASVSEFWTPVEMVNSVKGRVPDERPRLFVSGTVVSLDEQLIYGEEWELALTDPVLRREIRHTYQVFVLDREIS